MQRVCHDYADGLRVCVCVVGVLSEVEIVLPFLPSNQQHQIAEGKSTEDKALTIQIHTDNTPAHTHSPSA